MTHATFNKVVGILVVQTCFCLLQVSSQFFNPNSNGCPSLFACPLRCQNGYVLDSNGCKTCKCADATGTGSSVGNKISQTMNPGGDPVNQGGASYNTPPTTTTFTSPCVRDSPCKLKCDYGFISGPNGCQFCICASPKFNENTYNPCAGAAPTCDAVCPHGLQTDPTTGCHRCVCDESFLETTTKQQPTTTLSPGECIMKITECQIKFPFGFMTDDSCLMCISKDDIYPPFIPEERQPMIRLSNPCIQGFDMCRIFCATGYRTGPRSCQYCACNG